jgi:sulfur-oxidizing protein SoxY
MKNINTIFALLIFSILSNQSLAAQNQMPTCISKQYGGVQIPANRISLIAPDIAEDGSVVSVGIEKIKSLPKGNFVKELSFYNEFRTEPVATFFLSEKMMSENLKTRIRLRESSHLYAVAKLDNGELIGGISYIKVTIGGCGGGGTNDAVIQSKKVCTE